jgi:uncharacterized membrane protein YeiH
MVAQRVPVIPATTAPGDAWLVGVVLAVVTFWLFAQTLLNVIPGIQGALGLDETVANLAVSITALMSGLFIVVFGGLADRLGRAKILRAGIVLSIVGSLLIVLTPADQGALTTSMIMAGRIVQGLSAACIMPSSLALIKDLYDGAQRKRAVSFWSIGSWGGSGFCALFGGLMAASFLGWRSIFVISIAIGVLSLLLGVIVLAVVVGIAGGITRDLLIGVPPQTFRDWRYLAAGAAAGLITFVAHGMLRRLERPILLFDAAGLALICVTGAATALAHRVGPVEAVVLGAITGVGGGVARDVLLGEIPVVLRTGLYAVPALIGATIVVLASERGSHSLVFPILGAAVCFAIRVAGIHFDLSIPQPTEHERAPD